jgi:triosephosphate isomerase
MCCRVPCVCPCNQVPWVLTGHSERRSLCAESNRAVGQKTGHALEVGLKVRWWGAGVCVQQPHVQCTCAQFR